MKLKGYHFGGEIVHPIGDLESTRKEVVILHLEGSARIVAFHVVIVVVVAVVDNIVVVVIYRVVVCVVASLGFVSVITVFV